MPWEGLTVSDQAEERRESTNIFQDVFDHEKGQKSAISGSAVSAGFFFSPVFFFPFSPDFLCSLVRKSPENLENFARVPGGEESVESCHVSGCHVVSVRKLGVGRRTCRVCKAGLGSQSSAEPLGFCVRVLQQVFYVNPSTEPACRAPRTSPEFCGAGGGYMPTKLKRH